MASWVMWTCPPATMPPLGYGVYVGPVAATLHSFGLPARAHWGWELDSLQAELAAGRPVIIWATYDMKLPGVETWVSSDGAASTVVKWQHTFIAIGYDEGEAYLVDAYDGVQIEQGIYHQDTKKTRLCRWCLCAFVPLW